MLRSVLQQSSLDNARPSAAGGAQDSSVIDQYSPLSAADCFEQALTVSVGDDSFRVYLNLPKTTGSPTIFVFHHGAGYSGLSAACLAKAVRLQSQQKLGMLSFDGRGHGSSQVGNTHDGPPDLSLNTLSNDLVNLLRTMFDQKDVAFVLVGHSMGGAVVTQACSEIQSFSRVLGLVILDVVEGSALGSLSSMIPLIDARPSTFGSKSECIKYHLTSHTIRNPTSARISVPGLITKRSPFVSDQEDTKDSNDFNLDLSKDVFTWTCDLGSSQPYWEGWYRGLSSKFLSQKTARLLVLAGTDRLDKDLLIGQMQGKYQLVVLPNVGHCLHEDDPSALAEVLISFARRNDTLGSDEILARLGKKPLPVHHTPANHT